MGHVILLNWSLPSSCWSLVKCTAMENVQSSHAELNFANEVEGEALPSEKSIQWQSTGHSKMQTRWQRSKMLFLFVSTCYYWAKNGSVFLNCEWKKFPNTTKNGSVSLSCEWKKFPIFLPLIFWYSNWGKRGLAAPKRRMMKKENDEEGELIDLGTLDKLETNRWIHHNVISVVNKKSTSQCKWNHFNSK